MPVILRWQTQQAKIIYPRACWFSAHLLFIYSWCWFIWNVTTVPDLLTRERKEPNHHLQWVIQQVFQYSDFWRIGDFNYTSDIEIHIIFVWSKLCSFCPSVQANWMLSCRGCRRLSDITHCAEFSCFIWLNYRNCQFTMQIYKTRVQEHKNIKFYVATRYVISCIFLAP